MAKTLPLIRPYLKWAGGKRQLLPEITRHLPRGLEDRAYYEPFVGAGAVFFALLPRRGWINDRNPQLIATYRAIREGVEDLITLLRRHEAQRGGDYYYRVRAMDRDREGFARLSDPEKAARMIFLNKTCYNGLYRVNSRGFFNVPYGNYKDPEICGEALLRRISGYLNSNEITILNGDFEQATPGADGNSFVYFDPPYDPPGKGGFTAYQPGGFGEAEQERLRDHFVRLTGRGARCLLSNADTGFIRDLYRGFEIIPVRARRAINSNAAGRGPVGEVLIKNYPSGGETAER